MSCNIHIHDDLINNTEPNTKPNIESYAWYLNIGSIPKIKTENKCGINTKDLGLATT